MQLILIGIDNSDVVGVDAELSSAHMLAEGATVRRSGLAELLLVERHIDMRELQGRVSEVRGPEETGKDGKRRGSYSHAA